MITYSDGTFHLKTNTTSYIFRVTKFGHLESLFYGERLEDESFEALSFKQSAEIGSTVKYDESDPMYSLDTMALDWSGIGKGDYRHSPAEIRMPDGTFVADFTYEGHRIADGNLSPASLPGSYGSSADVKTLEIILSDRVNLVTLLLYYSVYEKTDVITRRTVIKNGHENPLVIRKLMSMMTDLPDRNYTLVTFQGGWIRETHRQDTPVRMGLYVNESTTGSSSNRRNPGFLLAEQGATETRGRVYGFNLVYSGNHYSGIELSDRGLVRVMTGINPHCFEWTLEKGGEFETPEAVMTFSNDGYNGTSGHFHDFVNEHIVRGDWKGKERPILLNTWESNFFDFTERKLMRLAVRAKKLGIELFVLDDGWFGKRDNDKAGLGDYTVNRKKLRSGLSGFSRRINRLGMRFGLWFEPEMVNPDSDLFRAHPEYAVRIPGRTPSLGRNQLVLDLCNPEVRDYIVNSVRGILDSADISYVKWDMNRHMSDMYSACIGNQGEFFHRYILGLYDLLNRIFGDRPGLLLESCSSGGNRFDLGMLCYSPQIWSSDDTDPVERLEIQRGLSYLYPLSTMGAHVSCAPHQQTLRATTLASRFNTASFGCLGYELDLAYLSRLEKKEVREQIAFYKEHRAVLQYGTFYRFDPMKPNKVHWETVSEDKSRAVAGFFQTQVKAAESFDFLPLRGLERDSRYSLRTRPQPIYVKRFGALINFLLPFRIHPEGFLMRLINRFYSLTDCVEEYEGSGAMLETGLKLNNQFEGTGYNPGTRLPGDFGSNLYVLTRLEDTRKAG